jgi:secreted trypsin-like serine protease
MGQVSMASCQGDSGGPVFVSGAGYGVLSAGSGTRSTRTGPGGSSVDCGTVAYYEDLTKGLNAMTVSLYTG